MDASDLAVLVETGELLGATKLFMVSLHCLWVYDYLLTVGDEIRYTPIFHLVWINTVMFNYAEPFCQRTKWLPIFHTSAVTVFSQITITLRIYAVTDRRKLPAGALSILTAAQIFFGIYSVVRAAEGSILQLPDINLDVFKICFYQRWRLGELLYTNLAIAFDLLAFSIILATTKRSWTSRFPGIPNILDTVMRDATLYFILIFASEILFLLFLFLAPTNIQLLPGVACVLLTPIMASRLMLSLKKVSLERAWCIATMADTDRGSPPEDATLHFAPQILGGHRENSDAFALANREEIELESTPRILWKRGSR